MPKLVLEVDAVYKNITRAVVLQVTDDIIKITAFPNKAKVYFKGLAKQNVNKESVMENTEEENIDFSHKDRVIVSAEFNYSDHNIFAAQPYRGNFKPIFYDQDHYIVLSPIYYHVELSLTLNFISKDRPTIEKWRSDMRRKIGQSIKAYQHRIDYTFPINEKFLIIMKHLYETKGKYVENKVSFVEWLASISMEKITGITNQIGKGLTPVVEQGQIGVMGLWNTDEIMDIEKLETGDLYQSNLTYVVRYSQPTILSLEYPIILNNNIISSDYRLPCDYNLPLVLGSPEQLVWGLDVTRGDSPKYYPSEPVRLPCFDEWTPSKFPMKTAGVYTALITIDENDPNYVMDLLDLTEDYQLADWFVELMEIFKEDLLYLGAAPIVVSLYRNENWMNSDLLVLDDDFRLYTKSELQFFNSYHVRVGVYTDLTLLSEKALEKLKKNGKLCQSLFKMLGPEYIDKIPPILSNGVIRKDLFFKFISLLKETNKNYKNNIEIRRFTVGSCVISLRRLEDAFSKRT